ncbi:hypothetical protein Tco_0836187 [Tanacetum coccineum]
MMTYLKHVGNFKHSDLKTKKFKEIQALYEKIKRSDEDFIAIGSAKDERLIKEMNEKGIDSSKNESVKEEDKEEEGTKKRKGGHIKMIARKKVVVGGGVGWGVPQFIESNKEARSLYDGAIGALIFNVVKANIGIGLDI